VWGCFCCHVVHLTDRGVNWRARSFRWLSPLFFYRFLVIHISPIWTWELNTHHQHSHRLVEGKHTTGCCLLPRRGRLQHCYHHVSAVQPSARCLTPWLQRPRALFAVLGRYTTTRRRRLGLDFGGSYLEGSEFEFQPGDSKSWFRVSMLFFLLSTVYANKGLYIKLVMANSFLAVRNSSFSIRLDVSSYWRQSHSTYCSLILVQIQYRPKIHTKNLPYEDPRWQDKHDIKKCSSICL
jgi:hypothetical protein